MKGSIRVARERDRSGMCEEARRLFIYLSTRTRLRSGEQMKFRINLPHSWPGVEGNRVPACIFRAIDHPERLPSPGDRSPQSAVRGESVRVLSSPALSPPNPFKKHLFTFRIFRTVLPTAANETRQRDTRAT